MIHVLGIPWTLKPSKGSNIVFKTLYSSKTHQVWRIDAMQTISNHICCCVSAVFSPQIFVSHWWKLWRHNAPHDEWRLPTSGRRRDVETDEFFWCFVCFVYAFTAVQCWLFESMCFGVSGSVRSRLNFKKQSRKNRSLPAILAILLLPELCAFPQKSSEVSTLSCGADCFFVDFLCIFLCSFWLNQNARCHGAPTSDKPTASRVVLFWPQDLVKIWDSWLQLTAFAFKWCYWGDLRILDVQLIATQFHQAHDRFIYTTAPLMRSNEVCLVEPRFQPLHDPYIRRICFITLSTLTSVYSNLLTF